MSQLIQLLVPRFAEVAPLWSPAVLGHVLGLLVVHLFFCFVLCTMYYVPESFPSADIKQYESVQNLRGFSEHSCPAQRCRHLNDFVMLCLTPGSRLSWPNLHAVISTKAEFTEPKPVALCH